MIKIKEIKLPMINLYSPEDEFLGEINEYQFYDAAIQITNEQVTGYYIIYNEEKIMIASKVIDNGTTKEDLEVEFNNAQEIFEKEKKYRLDDYKGMGEIPDYEPYVWGNDILPGFDEKR